MIYYTLPALFLLTAMTTPLIPVWGAAQDRLPHTETPFRLAFPVACEYGETCWPMNYTDHDRRDGEIKDAACHAQSYDGHKGTDIAISNWQSVLDGVAIIAPAPGTVLGIRNNQSDQFPSEADKARIRAQGRECGNGVRLDHGDGWITQFCHMKKGSVSVDFGDKIETGTPLGHIGMSGITDHPHMHMSLTKDGEVIDPFTGRVTSEPCGLEGARSLWADDTPYKDFSLYDAGFSVGRPDFKKVARGQDPTPPHARSASLVFYMSYFGARQGDKINLSVSRPDGSVFASQDIDQEKTRARQHYFTGKRNTKGRFMTGTWTAKATITRKDTGKTQTLTRTWKAE